nr:hypothetical protein [Spongiactinospora rosea]
MAEQAVSKPVKHGEFAACVRQLQALQELPVDSGPHRVRSLTVGEVLGELHHRHQGQLPGWHSRTSAASEGEGEILIGEEHPQLIAHSHRQAALGRECLRQAAVRSGACGHGRGRIDTTHLILQRGRRNAAIKIIDFRDQREIREVPRNWATGSSRAGTTCIV